MKSLAVFGTGSDVGKTTIVMALCRIFSDQDIKVAPFKAQNVSNNSAVTKEDREISRAQCLQAEAARISPSYLFNPVLLKSHENGIVQVIVNGLVYKKLAISTYYEEIEPLKLQVQQAFTRLQQDYDLVIAEGAGSPVELNLLDKDLSNSFIAKTFNTKNILVADIGRGGIFASIYGTMALMDPSMRSNLIGVVINKFQGDSHLFEEGVKIINERFGLPVLGVLPFKVLNIDMDDSDSIKNYEQRQEDIKIRIAVIAYPGLVNYNDLDVLMADPEIFVELISTYRHLVHFDMILLPGSKSVISDLQWLKQQGLFEELQQFNKPIFGISGGYQMFAVSLHDPDALEHDTAIIESGLAFMDDIVLYQSPLIVQSGNYQLFTYPGIKGYEIHNGQTGKYPLFYQRSHYAGTHVHGVFDDDEFRGDYFRAINSDYQGYNYSEYREQQIQNFTNMVADNLDTKAILQALQPG